MKLSSEETRKLQEWYGSGQLDARSAAGLELPPEAFGTFLKSNHLPDATIASFLNALKKNDELADNTGETEASPALHAQFEILNWALRVMQTETEQENGVSALLIALGKAALKETPAPAYSLTEMDAHQMNQEKTIQETAALIRQKKGDGAAFAGKEQAAFTRAYATYLDQRRDLMREGLALTKQHQVSSSTLFDTLGEIGLPKPQVEAYRQELAVVEKEKPEASPHRYGGVFHLVSSRQDPNEHSLFFINDQKVV